MATNAELSAENEALKRRIEELENLGASGEGADLQARVEELEAENEALRSAAPASPAANAGPTRTTFGLSEGTRHDLVAAARDTNEDGKRRVVKDVGSGNAWVITRNADGEIQVQGLQDQEADAFTDDPEAGPDVKTFADEK